MVAAPLPLVVHTDTSFLHLFNIDEKGYKKSIEQKQLWHLHKSGRLLPYNAEHRLDTIKAHAGWYEAIITLSKNSDQDANTIRKHQAQANQKNREHEGLPANMLGDDVLAKLASRIAERHKSMSEGSYTSYLFSQGIDKIRKKLGEEAVELVLAKGTSHIQSETADLLYHLLVFLEAESISWESIVQKLRDRAEGS